MRFLLSAFSIALAVQGGFFGFKSVAAAEAPPGKDAGPGRIEQIPPSAPKPLADVKGVVSWKTLGEVQVVKQKDKFIPQFSNTIAGLDKKEVRLQGFMMPLEMGDRQKRFILSAMPPSCAFCLPGGPDQIVEIQAKSPVKYGFEPIVVSGKLAVLKDDPMGLYYRLTDAVVVAQ